MIDQPAQENAIARMTEIGSYTSGVGTAVGGVMGWLNEYGIAIGAICAVITCAANIYFKWREVQQNESRKKLDS